MADEIAVEIDVESFRHSLLPVSRRLRESDLGPERIQDCQSFSDLAGFLAFFEIDDEPHPRAGGQGEILLRDTQLLAGVPDQFADLRGRVSQRPTSKILPYGNIISPTRRCAKKITVRKFSLEL